MRKNTYNNNNNKKMTCELPMWIANTGIEIRIKKVMSSLFDDIVCFMLQSNIKYILTQGAKNEKKMM